MKALSRRRFLQYGLGVGGAMALPWPSRINQAHTAAGGTLTKYLEALRRPGAGIVVATPSGPNDRTAIRSRRDR